MQSRAILFLVVEWGPKQSLPHALLSSLRSPAVCLVSLQGQTKKGAVSNYFVPLFRCQRGLNSSLRSSDSAAKGGQCIIGSKR